MENLFDHILDKDEKIIKVFKPNKRKLYLTVFVSYFFAILFFLGPMATGLALDSDINLGESILALSIGLIVLLLPFLIVYLFAKMYYNKRVYAYSNKRIIIRTGVIGVDFKSLDMQMIGAVNVYVSLLDKIARKNTGSIRFGSTASPISANSGGVNPYQFSNVVAPYELYKEIKNAIDEFKEQQSKKN